eukprot:365537-Chlamydomonas_euryale.AAC.3
MFPVRSPDGSTCSSSTHSHTHSHRGPSQVKPMLTMSFTKRSSAPYPAVLCQQDRGPVDLAVHGVPTMHCQINSISKQTTRWPAALGARLSGAEWNGAERSAAQCSVVKPNSLSGSCEHPQSRRIPDTQNPATPHALTCKCAAQSGLPDDRPPENGQSECASRSGRHSARIQAARIGARCGSVEARHVCEAIMIAPKLRGWVRVGSGGLGLRGQSVNMC